MACSATWVARGAVDGPLSSQGLLLSGLLCFALVPRRRKSAHFNMFLLALLRGWCSLCVSLSASCALDVLRLWQVSTLPPAKRRKASEGTVWTHG